MASERAFAARAQQVNARQGFVEFFAPDAVLFSPVAAAAFPRLRDGPDWPLNIQWRPVAAAICGAGDMGYTAGPAEYRRAPSEPPIGYGHYTSVWQKQADGQYRVRIDVGIDHPAPQVPVADWSVPVQPPQAAPAMSSRQRDVARAALRELDARTGAASSGAQAAALADRALLKELPGLHIDESPKFTKAHKELQEAWVMALCAPNNQPEEVYT